MFFCLGAQKHCERNAFFVLEHKNTVNVMCFCLEHNKHCKRNAFFALERKHAVNVMRVCVSACNGIVSVNLFCDGTQEHSKRNAPDIG